MNTKAILHGLRALGLALLAGFLVSAPTHAYAAGHFGGGGHVGGVGFHGGGFRGGVGFRGGFRGGYGWRGGYGCCGWGWGWPGYGLFLATLPFYYSTVWWEGQPYYYADDNYYLWNGAAGGYTSVPPPQSQSQSQSQAPGPQGDSDLFAYPKNAQTAEQQARDKQECRSWAASQIGSGAAPMNRWDNLRAQTACLEGRGYSVR